jgi:hypothetical protein
MGSGFIVVVVFLALVSPAQAGPTASQRCEAAKLQTATRYTACRGRATATAIKRGDVADFTRCDDLYSKRWQRWEALWGVECPTVGDEAAMKAQCTSCVDAYASALSLKTAFLSSVSVNGNLGGVAGANALCNSLAATAGLGGTFKAWLSDGATSPSTTFTQSIGAYVRVDGVVIATNWTDLTDDALAASLNVDEFGTEKVTFAWTGTSGAGAPGQFGNCLGWTSDSSSEWGQDGAPTLSGVAWTALGAATCHSLLPIYCFEQ